MPLADASLARELSLVGKCKFTIHMLLSEVSIITVALRALSSTSGYPHKASQSSLRLSFHEVLHFPLSSTDLRRQVVGRYPPSPP